MNSVVFPPMCANVQKYSMTIGTSFCCFRKHERSNRQKSFRGKFLCESWNRVRINRSSPSIHVYRVNINGMKKKIFLCFTNVVCYRNNRGDRNGFFFCKVCRLKGHFFTSDHTVSIRCDTISMAYSADNSTLIVLILLLKPYSLSEWHLM